MGDFKFKLGQRVLGRLTNREYRILGIDESGDRRLGYLVERYDGNGAVIDKTWKALCTQILPGIPTDTKGSWMNERDLVPKDLIPSGPVYTPNISAYNEPTPIKEPVYLRRFESGAVRSDDRGRENPAFISPYALKFLAQHLSASAALFNNADSAKNYMKGIEPKDIEASLERHVLDFKFAMLPNRRGNTANIKKALVEIMANCVMGLHQIGLAEDGDYEKIYEQVEYIKQEDNV